MPYFAPAVHFDGSSYLARGATLTGAIATPKFLFSVWIKAAVAEQRSVASTFPNDSWNPYLNGGPDVFTQQVADFDFSNGIFPKAGVSINGLWQNYLVSMDVSENDPDKVIQILLNGSPSLDYTPGSVPGFTISFNLETDCYIGWDGYQIPGLQFLGDMADLQLWIGINPDLTNPANVAKFISGGRPVDPAIAAAEFGPPILLFSGDATGFQTNQGTGGAFTLTGSLTDAPTSPSDLSRHVLIFVKHPIPFNMITEGDDPMITEDGDQMVTDV